MKIFNKKSIFLVSLIFIISLFFVSPTLSKYKNETVKRVISLFTRYNVTYITGGGRIINSQNFSSYVSILGLTLPAEDDIDRIGYDFNGWYLDNSFIGSPITRIPSGSEGEKTYYASWIVSRYTLTVNVSYGPNDIEPGLPDDWDLVIGKDQQGNDILVTLDSNGEVVVDKGETVSLRTRYSQGASLTGWTINEDIVFTERYTAGDQYIYYDFRMPRHNVTATYGEENDGYIDLAKSPITFEEGVNLGSRTQDGFWYQSTIRGMSPLKTDVTKGNFYAWNNSDTFYVTSKGVATQNQLTLVGNTTVSFKDCVMAVTDDYSNDVVDRKIGATVMETKGNGTMNDTASDAWKSYGNIVLSYDQNITYTVNLIVEDDNTLGAIFTNEYHKNEGYKITLNINGDNKNNDIAYIASVWGNMDLNFNNLTINEYDNNTELQEDYPDNSEYITWVGMGPSAKGNIKFTTSILDIPTKRVYDGYAYIYFNGTTGDVGSIRTAYMFYFQASSNIASNIHVLGDAYTYYYGMNVTGSSKVIIDGDYRINGYSTSGSSIGSGLVIIKGNLFDTGSLSMSGGTLIANVIALGSSASISGGKIITNMIINNPNGRPTFNSSTGYQTTTFGGTTSLTLANQNNDNIPFRTYTNNYASATSYTFSGGTVYLYGYYELDNGILSNTYTTKSVGNPLKAIVEEYEANGMTNIDDTYLNNRLVQTNNETMALGDSSRTTRTVRFSGATIKSAGNLTTYNNTVISNGNINVMGTLSSKNNLTISGGTVTANEIGNAYNLYTTTNSLSNWKETSITGGTITTNKIGAVTRKINNVNPKSYVSIGTSATFTAKDNSVIDIDSDVYINYVYSNLFSNNVNNPTSLNFNGSITSGTNKTLNNLVLIDPTPVNNKVDILKPTLISDGQPQKWKHDSLNGVEANYVDDDGYLNGDTNSDPIYLNSQFNLYAAKEFYNLRVHGTGYSATSNNDPITFTSDESVVRSGSEVILQLSNVLMTPKTVIWYFDDSGMLHNAIASANDIDLLYGTITFDMPSADTDIYITDELELDLYKYEIAFTSDGFAVEYDSTSRRSDSEFVYSGDIKVTQSNVKRVTNRISHGTSTSGYLSTPFDMRNAESGGSTSTTTDNRIRFESGSDTLTRDISFKWLRQAAKGSYGIYIDDYVDVDIIIDTQVWMAPVKLPEHSNLTISGDDNTVDMLCINGYDVQIGNLDGKTGNVTISNIEYINYQGKNVIAKNKSTSNLVFNNVKMDLYVYYRISIANNITNIELNNSDVYAIVSGDTANQLFSGITNVTFNNTAFRYTSGGGRNHNNLFLGTTNMYIEGTSNILYNYDNSSSSLSKFETYTYSSLATKVEVSDSAIVSIDHRIRFKKLIVNDTAQVKIEHLGSVQADIDKSTYLLAENIEVNGGLVQADNIIISGWYYGNQTNESSVLTALQSNSNILNGSTKDGLVITGGTVRAYNFVGGDVNAKINVNGGTLEALGIGTSGKLYGYASYLPIAGEDYVYSIDKIPNAGTIVNITSGTVNVLANGYLGGMRAAVNISGGVVNLASGAILGINDSDRTILYNDATSQGNTPSNFVSIAITGGEVTGTSGIITAPYSTLNISGANTGVNVSSILADKGTINISNLNTKYVCPINNAVNVGIKALNEIAALSVNVTSGASVYGGKIVTRTIDSTDIGLLLVDNTSSIYTNSYGSEGQGTNTVTINGTAVGSRQYSIKYIMNDSYQDRATNSNQEYYISGVGLQLADPERYGYTFTGWYLNNTLVTEVSTSQTGDITLEARWVPDTVGFKVTISASDVGLNATEFANEVSGLDGVLNGNTFTFNGIVNIDYRELIVSNNGINLTNYNLNNHLALSIKIKNSTLNPEDEEINVGTARVSQEIMEYYLANNGDPIELAIVSIS